VGFTVGAVEAGGFTAEAVGLLGFTAEAVASTVEAVGLLDFMVVAGAGMVAVFMDLLPMVAWPTWGTGGAAMH
jgi:hypothetical protein